MGGFRIYQDNYADFTIVSNYFIDEYMEDANDAQLKVYLYLIRMLNADLPTGISDIADRFNYTEKDVERALRYWEKKHVISLEYDSSKNLIGVCLLPLNSTTTSASAIATVVAHPASKSVPTEVISEPVALKPVAVQSVPDFSDRYAKPTYSKDELRSFRNTESSSQLVFVAEQYLHKTLSVAELSTLLYISDTLKFSDDLIDYLLQYCVGREKTDHRYIEAVALDWAQSGITTPKQASAHARKYDKIVYEVMSALGKTSNPTNVEVSYINRWTKEYSYDMNVISVACERTVLNTDKKRFSYADSILSRWHNMGVRNKADIEIMDPVKKRPTSSGQNHNSGSTNKFNQFTQTTYDYESLEKEYLSN